MSAHPTHDAVPAAPIRQLGVRHGLSVCVGMVIGAGIFKTSPQVAASLSSDTALYFAWAFGGVMSLAGALCFAEMAAAFPDAGGDYHFLRLAWGPRVGFLFAWSRYSVIHSGSMALLAFVFADYVGQVVPLQAWLGPYGGALCAAGLIALLTALNLLGVRVGLGTQVGLMAIVLGGLVLLVASGVTLAAHGIAPATPAVAVAPVAGRVDWGTAMVFVFLAYGGWSDAATLSSEMRDGRRGIVVVLVAGLGLVTVMYLGANWAYLRALGLDGLAASAAPAADAARRAFGAPGAWAMVAIVATTAVSVLNAVLVAGARTTYAAARDLQFARSKAALGHWDAERGTPPGATLALGGMALALVAFGAATRGGFATMVDYLSPVYWGFLTLSALALPMLRRRQPHVPRPFVVPLYPLLPLAFAGCSAWLLYASLAYVKQGALAGVGVLGVGALLLEAVRRRRSHLPSA